MGTYEKELLNMIEQVKTAMGGDSIDHYFLENSPVDEGVMNLCEDIMEKLCEGAKAGIDLDSILAKIDENYNRRLFWAVALDDAKKKGKLYLQCGSLRKMDTEKRTSLWETLFTQRRLEKEDMSALVNMFEVDSECIDAGMSILKEAKEYIMDKGSSKEQLALIFEKFFGLDNDSSDTVWRLFVGVKNDILRRAAPTKMM